MPPSFLASGQILYVWLGIQGHGKLRRVASVFAPNGISLTEVYGSAKFQLVTFGCFQPPFVCLMQQLSKFSVRLARNWKQNAFQALGKQAVYQGGEQTVRKTFRLKTITQGAVGFIRCRKKPKLGCSSELKIMVGFSFTMPLAFLQIRNAFQKHGGTLVCTLKLQHGGALCSPPQDHHPGGTACCQRGLGGPHGPRAAGTSERTAFMQATMFPLIVT